MVDCATDVLVMKPASGEQLGSGLREVDANKRASERTTVLSKGVALMALCDSTAVQSKDVSPPLPNGKVNVGKGADVRRDDASLALDKSRVERFLSESANGRAEKQTRCAADGGDESEESEDDCESEEDEEEDDGITCEVQLTLDKDQPFGSVHCLQTILPSTSDNRQPSKVVEKLI